MSYPPQPGRPPLYAGYPPPYSTHRKSTRGLWIALATVVLLTGIVAVLVVVFAGRNDKKHIAQAIEGFAEAVDTGNMPKMLGYLCAAEARQITERDDYDSDETSRIDPIKRLPVNIGDVQIRGDTATARLSRPPAQPRTLRLKKEAGIWKLCNPGPP
jgi:hypothetical protein